MGGKKKLGIKQMEKSQVKADEDKAKEAKKKEKAGPPKERKNRWHNGSRRKRRQKH
jgi:hypothetical protein